MGRKIGVFVCHCGVNIAQTVDVEALTKYASTLDGVVVSESYKYMCSDQGAQLIKKSIKKYMLDGVVIACCSPRMHEHTFRQVVEDGGINQFNLEIANIREQCSWVHDDKEAATEKAKTLVRAAVAKTKMLESLKSSTISVTPKALVIGGGIAGIQASLDLADSGYKVSLVERSPSIGGRMAQLDKTFPTLDCSSCILTPKMMEVLNHPNIELLTYSEVLSVEGTIGNYVVELSRGTGIKNEPIYGVTLLEREDTGFSTSIGTDISKPFFNSKEAENYFTNLVEAVKICQSFEGDTFRNCVKRELEGD